MSKIDERAFQAVLLHALNDCPAMLSTEDCRGLIEAYEAAVTPSGVRSAHADDAGQSCPQPPTHQPEIPPKRVVRNAEKQIVGIEPSPEAAQQPDKCRAAFEKRYLEEQIGEIGSRDWNNSNQYLNDEVQKPWFWWQAAWNARPERESGHLKYLEDWHYVTQSLIGTVELHLSTGDYEKAKQRMAHYKALLPHFSVDEKGRRG